MTHLPLKVGRVHGAALKQQSDVLGDICNGRARAILPEGLGDPADNPLIEICEARHVLHAASLPNTSEVGNEAILAYPAQQSIGLGAHITEC